jgi:hypothetical protein
LQDQETDSLTYRRQFLLGPRIDPRLAGWHRTELDHGLVLQTHPDLSCIQATRNHRTITLLGFAIAPGHPEWSHREILDWLLGSAVELSDVLARTDELAGRWAMIVEDDERVVLFGDAMGLRAVVYSLPPNAELWCGSQTNIVADQLALTPSGEALDFWQQSGNRIAKHTRGWPGASTAFDEIGALLPNHYLDLMTREVVRFFPREPLAKLTLQDGVGRIAEHLRRSIRAAHLRQPIHQQVTAGLDSRCLLAASREVSSATTYFTCIWPMIDPMISEGHRDVTVPAQVLGSLGLRHRVIRCPDRVESGKFARAFALSDMVAFEELAPTARTLAEALPPDVLIINGNGGEVGRCFLHRNEHPRNVNLTTMRNLRWPGMYDHPFLKRHLSPWLAEANDTCARHGYRVLDLFYWEQKMRWAAQSFLHMDLANETCSPYNCRALLQDFLRVPEEFRRPEQGYVLQRKVIEALWPETLQSGVNPATFGDRIARMGRRLRRHASAFGVPI